MISSLLGTRTSRLLPLLISYLCLLVAFSHAQVVETNDPPSYGPFNATFLPDGPGLSKPLVEHDTLTRADLPWTIYAWVRASEPAQSLSLIAGLGDPTEEYPRYLAVNGNKLLLWVGKDNELSGASPLASKQWHMLAATFDGSEFHLYGDGTQVASGKLVLGSVGPTIQIAPAMLPVDPTQRVRARWQHFGGDIAGLTVTRRAFSATEIKQLSEHAPEPQLSIFEEGSKPWEIQTKGQAGYRAPQDAATLPRGKAQISRPVAKKIEPKPALEPNGANSWTLAGGWTLIEAPKLKADVSTISKPGYKSTEWMVATVPGTVLTTMIDRGIYPDPDYGLNNLAIPESLNKQDYWYRTSFKAPVESGKRFTLTFEGINYKAQVWLNGKELGTIKGAFRRGIFDVTDAMNNGENVLVVRVSPPPHPGIPQEQSVKGGPGENGGIMCLDGPTFVATEGWDWIPAIRDRNTGIWQPVRLTATGSLKVGDPRVVTALPLPDTSRADVTIEIPVENTTGKPEKVTLEASFDQTRVSKTVEAPEGITLVKFTPEEFSQLHVQNPRLWWPNGYGKQELYTLNVGLVVDGKTSDQKSVRFGIREITYELSLLDEAGHLQRVEYSPTAATQKNEKVVDVTHAGMREIPPVDPYPPDMPEKWKAYWKNWVASLKPGAMKSSAIRQVSDTRSTPYLVIKVNGVRIACRGGNWGMDDSRKRVSREKLEPYFRLQHDANLNIIRNWVGQDTEETFYDLADEYGMLIWNDFWATTQNYNIEPEDPQLFLENARDTISRFRNHPSIAVWCGRNEGVPQPIINEGLDKLIAELDGTRYYSPSSNVVNLANSGPYKFTDPVLYYTTLNHGFSVETGTPSMSTLESFQTWIPKEDQWPINDTWAYHDWHQSGNGDTGTFMAEIQAEFGAPTSLEDFERKAQMLNYVSHRAIFEGMNAHLWSPNSARMLWMTQPAWPSTMWQILSSDYDTQASYYAVKKAAERIHVQLDLSNYTVQVINNTTEPLNGMTVSAAAYSVTNKPLLNHSETKEVPPNSKADAYKLDLSQALAEGAVLLRLELHDSRGHLQSDNFYWLGADSASLRDLNKLPPVNLAATAKSSRNGQSAFITLHLQNQGSVAALSTKLTLVNAGDGKRILPAYYSDNYISLLPGESRDVTIEYPSAAAKGAAQVNLRGWNTVSTSISSQ